MNRKINSKRIIVYILSLIIFFSFSRFSCKHTPPNHDLIKLTNESNRRLIFYINTLPSDTNVHLLNITDSQLVYSVDYHNDEFYMTSVSPFENTYFRGPKYCYKPFWDKYLKSGVLIVYVIDKSELLSNRDIHKSILKKMELTYDYFFFNSCTIVYKD